MIICEKVLEHSDSHEGENNLVRKLLNEVWLTISHVMKSKSLAEIKDMWSEVTLGALGRDCLFVVEYEEIQEVLAAIFVVIIGNIVTTKIFE